MFILLSILHIFIYFLHAKSSIFTAATILNRPKRLGNGHVIDISDYPYAVKIRSLAPKSNHSICGVLITLNWVLTATSAIDTFIEKPVKSTENGTDNKIHYEVYAESREGIFTTSRKVESLQNFPNASKDLDDLTLLKLEAGFNGTAVTPVKLVTNKELVKKCKTAKVIGIGIITPGIYLEVPQTILVSKTKCPSVEYQKESTLFCVTSPRNQQSQISNNSDFCSENSGAPVICNKMLIGVARNTCQSEWHSITNVAFYMDWLQNVTGVNISFNSIPNHELRNTSNDYEGYYDITKQKTKTSADPKRKVVLSNKAALPHHAWLPWIQLLVFVIKQTVI